MRRIFLTVFMMGVFLSTAFSQQGEDCKKLIKEYLKSMSAYNKSDPDKVYFLEMTMDTYYKPDAETEDTHVDLKIIIAGSRLEYESNVMNYYMDDKESFVVVHPQKAIILNDGGGKNKVDKYASMMALEDTLLKHSIVNSCGEVEKNGRKQKQIILTADKLFKAATGVSKVEYMYDLKEKRIVKSTISYSEKSPKKEDVVNYKKLDYNYGIVPFKKASEKVMTAQGALLSKYKGYELIDNRNYSKK